MSDRWKMTVEPFKPSMEDHYSYSTFDELWYFYDNDTSHGPFLALKKYKDKFGSDWVVEQGVNGRAYKRLDMAYAAIGRAIMKRAMEFHRKNKPKGEG